MKLCIVYSTFPDMNSAKSACKSLLDKKLVACCNMVSSNSFYFWNGNLENSDEIICLFKTKLQNWKAVKSQIEKVHPYDVPCILKFEVDSNEKYFKWVDNSD